MPIQAHIDELKSRAGHLLAIFTALMLISWYWIDPLLEAYLGHLSPCLDCIIVYSPTEWVGLRWLAIVLLACVLTTPFAFYELIRFSASGMLSAERLWLRRFLASGSLIAAALVVWTLGYFLPEVFATAEISGQVEGVSPRYSAAAMLEVALVVGWVELIITLSTIAASLLSRFGLTVGVQSDLWRLRLHGISIFSLWLVVPAGFEGLLVLSILACVLLTEYGFRMTPLRSLATPLLAENAGILDEEARLRRIGVVDCACAGACPRSGIETLPASMLGFSTQALCLEGHERDMLIQAVRTNRLTDLIIGGCDSNPVPDHFTESLSHLGCSLRGLSLMDVECLRDGEEKFSGLQLNVHLASRSDPWRMQDSTERRAEVLERFGLSDADISLVFEAESGHLGLSLSATEIFVPK